jgi:hypothetical protein
MGFFRKLGSGIKRIAQKVGGGIVKGAKFVGKNALTIGQMGLGLLGKVPGVVGTAANSINKGIDIVKGLVKHVPNTKAQNVLNNVADKIQNTTGRAVDTISSVHEKVTPAAHDIVGAIGKIPGVT